MEQPIYLQLFSTHTAAPKEQLYIKDIARMEGDKEKLKMLLNLPVYQIRPEDKSHVVIDGLTVLQHIHTYDPDVKVTMLGRAQTVIRIETKRKVISPLLVLFVWFLLFIGAALAIMNFHEDVSMLQVHQKLYQLITGKELEQPLLLQVPYSFGLGLGMILFFNHLFKKRINEEPSPLEIEMFQYRQDVEQYLAETNAERDSKWPSKL